MVDQKDNELILAEMQKAIQRITDEVGGIRTEIKNVKEIANNANRSVRDIEEEYPLLPPESDDLSKAVRKKGVSVLGGKKSSAYGNTDLRKKVYRDIYGEVKRQYGLVDEKGRQQSYKKLKRKYLAGALIIVSEYEPPIAIANEIDAENDLDDMD